MNDKRFYEEPMHFSFRDSNKAKRSKRDDEWAGALADRLPEEQRYRGIGQVEELLRAILDLDFSDRTIKHRIPIVYKKHHPRRLFICCRIQQ
jgi:hypothetical protein